MWGKKTCLLVEQEDICSCSARRLVPREDMSSCPTRRHMFLLNRQTCLLVEPEDVSSCWTRRHVSLLNKKTRLLVGQQDNVMSLGWTRRHVSLLKGGRVFLSHKKTCLLVEQEDMSPCETRRPVLLLTKRTCLQHRPHLRSLALVPGTCQSASY